MADITELPPPKKSRVTRYPHGTPRNRDRLLEIARLRNVEKMQWRDIGPVVGMTGQGACLLYNHWHQWLVDEGVVTTTEEISDTA